MFNVYIQYGHLPFTLLCPFIYPVDTHLLIHILDVEVARGSTALVAPAMVFCAVSWTL